ncbi:DEAD-box helicase Dbp80 [Trichonephila inaurata madagascariensis]|uniref:RNA helicase n=1 Tax=Trichonephila inaurata madagascariensis TaxID=2747483 RepID=A0A8X6YMT2_9ARAC|nr:DEAD-box helicase Dbp80 [Trichonephila inaurata madagascariensis]
MSRFKLRISKEQFFVLGTMATAYEDWGFLAELQVRNLKDSFKSYDLIKNAAQDILTQTSITEKCNEKQKAVLNSNSVAFSCNSPSVTEEMNDAEDPSCEKSLSPAEISAMQKVLRCHLLESAHEVEVLRRDERSPLYSVKSFEQLQLPPNLLKGVYGMGFNAPSKIQETTLPLLFADPPVNLIAQSQSGTGKTAAFVLACLGRIRAELRYPQVLILSPTYELAMQIGQVAQKMAQFCSGIEFRFAVKGQKLPKGYTITEHILIGTPGKVFDWGRRYRYFDFNKLSIFVLDEADIMISIQGHHDQCVRIHRMASRKCQTILFSATYSAEVMEFAEMIISDPIIIRLKREEETLENVKQYYIECNSACKKYSALINIYGVLSIGQAIIFCRTKRTAEWLGNKMSEDGHSVGYLSSELNMDDRLDTLTRFREGKEKVLITTNVCARGIDIEQVTIVVNFDLPVTVKREADCETYLHRIGRSGRFGKRGIAINMVESDSDLQVLKTIEEHFGRKIFKLNADDVDALEELNA